MKRYKTSTLKLIKISLIVLLSLLLVSTTLPSLIENTSYVAYATNDGVSDKETNAGDSSEENAAGSGNLGGTSTGYQQGGFNTEDEGLRLYLINQNGTVVSKVIDVIYDGALSCHHCYSSVEGNYFWDNSLIGSKTAIGNADVYMTKHVSDYGELLEGMPHITIGGNSNHGEWLSWMLAADDAGTKKVNKIIAGLFGKGTKEGDGYKEPINGKDPYDAYMEGEGDIKLVVEALHWYVPAKATGSAEAGWSPVGADYVTDTNGGGTYYFVYGNIQWIAAQNLAHHDLIHSGQENYGGWVTPCSELWPTCMFLDENESDIRWGLPNKLGGRVYGDEIVEQAKSTHSITTPVKATKYQGVSTGYGMNIFRPEETVDIWATYQATQQYYEGGVIKTKTVGGGEPPVEAPYMGPADGTHETFAERPIRIIKIYEEIMIKNDGSQEFVNQYIKYDSSMSACRTIEIQSEPGWNVVHWFTWDNAPSLSNYWASCEPTYYMSGQTGTGPDTVYVNQYMPYSYDYLTVHLVKYVQEEAEPEKVEIIINESEITHTYTTGEITDMGPQEMEWNFGSMSGTCTKQLSRTVTKTRARRCSWGRCSTYSVVEGRDTWKPYHGDVCPDGGTESYTDTEYYTCGTTRTLSSAYADKAYNYKFKLDTSIDKKILSDKTNFKPVANLDTAVGRQGSISSISGGTNKVTNITSTFVVWRGDDKPTRAKFHTVGSEIDALIGTAQNTTANATRKSGQGMYKKTVTLKFIHDNSGDYSTKSACPSHDNTKSTTHTLAGSKTVAAEAKVYYYSGQQKSPATTYPNLTQIITKNFGNGAQGSSTNSNGNITSAHQTWLMKYSQSLKFTPYIRMSYMTNASLTAKHNADILSQWPSEMVIGAGMTIGWKSNEIFIE